MTATPDSASIVVGVDDSTGSRAALSWAADEASHHGAPLALVYAWRPMYQSEADPLGHTDAGAVSQTRGDAMLIAALSSLRVSHPELAVSRHLVKGRPSAVLLDAVADARMLVVGARGLGGFDGLSLGSVGLHVVSYAPCPVVVVRSTQAGKGPVIVGVDGSDESNAVLSAAFEEAALRSSPLAVTWALYVHSKAEGVPDHASALAALEAEARPVLEQLLANASQRYPDVEVQSAFPAGYAAEVLVRESATAPLLVIGSHGAGGFVDMELGSIAHAVVHQVHCPVMVVRDAVLQPATGDER